MKNRTFSLLTLVVAALTFMAGVVDAKSPKKLLVVTVTKGFRHSSIATAEKVIGDLAASNKTFTVDYVGDDAAMAEKMTMASLKQYDGVIFANTTGDLPLPDT